MINRRDVLKIAGAVVVGLVVPPVLAKSFDSMPRNMTATEVLQRQEDYVHYFISHWKDEWETGEGILIKDDADLYLLDRQ